MTSVLLHILAKILLLVGLGFLLRRREIITARFEKELTAFTMDVALPGSILTAAGSAFSKETSEKLMIFAGITLCMYIFTLFAGYLITKVHSSEAPGLVISMLVFGNIAFVGFPLTTALFPEEGPLFNATANVIYIAFFYTLGTTLISGKSDFHLSHILRTPVGAASVATLFIYISPFCLPPLLLDFCSTLGAMVIPLSMILIGCSLAGIPFLDVLRDRWAMVISALRLVIFPLGLVFILSRLPAVPRDVAFLAGVLTCVPTGSMCLIFAQRYENHPHFAARVIVQSMLLMVITIPLFMTIASALLDLHL